MVHVKFIKSSFLHARTASSSYLQSPDEVCPYWDNLVIRLMNQAIKFEESVEWKHTGNLFQGVLGCCYMEHIYKCLINRSKWSIHWEVNTK